MENHENKMYIQDLMYAKIILFNRLKNKKKIFEGLKKVLNLGKYKTTGNDLPSEFKHYFNEERSVLYGSIPKSIQI